MGGNFCIFGFRGLWEAFWDQNSFKSRSRNHSFSNSVPEASGTAFWSRNGAPEANKYSKSSFFEHQNPGKGVLQIMVFQICFELLFAMLFCFLCCFFRILRKYSNKTTLRASPVAVEQLICSTNETVMSIKV